MLLNSHVMVVFAYVFVVGRHGGRIITKKSEGMHYAAGVLNCACVFLVLIHILFVPDPTDLYF